MPSQTIRLNVPAEPAFARSVRMMAANLAVVCKMSVDEVEDMRMAAEEGFVLACATRPSDLDVTFTLDESHVEMDFSLGADSPDEPGSYAGLLLSAVCDEYLIDADRACLHLVKRIGLADGE